jgi:hypothetical protein
MNNDRLRTHIMRFLDDSMRNPDKFDSAFRERKGLVEYYQSFTEDRILSMQPDDIYDYLSKLWAMLIWGNKHYIVDKIIEDNSIEKFKKQLAQLVWGKADIEERWELFRKSIKWMGPAMISEILCKTHPSEFMLWNSRAYVALKYLEVAELPKYDHQVTGRLYKYLCDVCREIAEKLAASGFSDTTLLAVDYFIWEQLQIEETQTSASKKLDHKEKPVSGGESEFIHNEIRDKLRDIGLWLGFEARTEQKVAEGSKVDTIWESHIGNMGRIIYIFEVQTRGSIDGLMVNLFKALNNPAVQGVVAVSDKAQLEKIKIHARPMRGLQEKLRYWNFEEVLKVHERLEYVFEKINNLKLVPEGF